MTCPICGSQTKVSQTRAECDCVRRYRVCLRCQHTFVTTEIDEDLLRKTQYRKDSKCLKLKEPQS